MSLEQALADNTAALTRVADLLEVSNADRAKLLASAGSASSPATTSDDGLSVADIKEAVKTASPETLAAMLATETGGKNRSQAVKAIEAAIAANGGKPEEPSAGTADAGSTQESQAASTSPAASSSDDKNAQPVPASVTPEAAAKAFGAWFGETDDEAERGKRRSFVEQIVAKLGKKISELDGDKARQAVFYLRRQRAGLPVDFAAAFDFNGSPTQDVSTPAATSGDDDLL